MSEATKDSPRGIGKWLPKRLRKDRGTGRQKAARLLSHRFGIGVRLLGAFWGVAFLTLAASGVAWLSFTNVGSVL